MSQWFKGRCSNCREVRQVHKLKSVQICTRCAGAVTNTARFSLIISAWKFPDIFKGKLRSPAPVLPHHDKAPNFFDGAKNLARDIGQVLRRKFFQRKVGHV